MTIYFNEWLDLSYFFSHVLLSCILAQKGLVCSVSVFFPWNLSSSSVRRSSDRAPWDRSVSGLPRSLWQPPELRLEGLRAGGNRNPSETKLFVFLVSSEKHFKIIISWSVFDYSTLLPGDKNIIKGIPLLFALLYDWTCEYSFLLFSINILMVNQYGFSVADIFNSFYRYSA